MKQPRPKNLNLFTIHFPIPAVISILHRISGVILFIFIPFLLWGLSDSLASQQTFDQLHQFLTKPLVKFCVWGFLAAFIYHFVAGIRHLLMDVHVGEGLKGGRVSSYLTLVVSVFLMIVVGVWLW